MLRSFINRVLLEQERSEEQEVKEVKDLFQRWIDEYSTSYLAHRKKVSSNSWVPTQISVKECYDFIFISLDFRENDIDDWFIIAYKKENKNIYCVKAQTLAFAPSLTFALHTLIIDDDDANNANVDIDVFDYYVKEGRLSKLPVNQFHRAMDVTKGNYAQFEVLVKRLGEMNQRNANV